MTAGLIREASLIGFRLLIACAKKNGFFIAGMELSELAAGPRLSWAVLAHRWVFESP